MCGCERKEREWERGEVYSCFIVQSKMDWGFFVKESFRSVRMSWEFFVEESYRSSRVDWLCVCPASKNGCASCQSVQSMSVCVHEAVCNFLTQPIWDSQTKWQINSLYLHLSPGQANCHFNFLSLSLAKWLSPGYCHGRYIWLQSLVSARDWKRERECV